MKILIIEDSVELCVMLKKFLIKQNFVCDYVHTASEAVELLDISKFDIALLDINLPDKNGLDVITQIRNTSLNPKIGIIMLSGQEKMLQALNLGADEFMLKPVDTDILLARVNSLIRRINDTPNTILKVNNLHLDTVKNLVTIDGQIVNLANKEFQILRYLMLVYPKVVTTEEIMEHVYDGDLNPFSSVLRVHISRLRAKLTKANKGVELIHTRKNMGYHL